MLATFRSKNRIALVILVVGKISGIAGLVVGGSHRVAGGALLGINALLIVTAVVLCLRTMKDQEKEASGHKDLLRQMMAEGTLSQYLRDLEAERKTAERPSAPAEREASPQTALT